MDTNQKQNSTERDVVLWKRQLDEFEFQTEQMDLQIEHVEKQIAQNIPELEAKEAIERFGKAIKENKDENNKEFTPVALLKVKLALEKMGKEFNSGIHNKRINMGLRQLHSQKENIEANKKSILKMMRNHEEQNGNSK